MRGQFRSILQAVAHSVTKHTKRTVVLTKLSVISTILITASLIPTIALPGTAHAEIDCGSVGVTQSGSTWLNNSGVNICNHPGDGTNACAAVSGAGADSHCTSYGSSGYVWSGTKWQCVELINRLYLTKGWTTTTWYGNGGGSDALTNSNHVPNGITVQNNGSISYINPGDVISLNNRNSDDGHAGVIDTISGTTYNIKNQNAQLSSSAYLSSGSLSGGNANLNMNAWSGYSVNAIAHHQSGSTGGSGVTPTAITINGVLNVFKVGGDEQVYQNYWNSGINNWNGWTGLSGYTPNNPAVVINNGDINLFIRGNDGQIYTEYDGSSGWSGWTSLGSQQMLGDPYAMLYGTSLNVFALAQVDSNKIPYEDTLPSGGTWTGWGSNTNYMASDPVAVTYGGNLHLIYRGGDNKPYENVFGSNGWSGFSEIGQYASVLGNPTALSYSAEGELDVYFGTGGNQIWKDTNQGSGWGTWTEMATGSMTGDPYIMAYNNDLQVFSRDTSNNIETRYWSYSGQSWSSWQSLGGSSDSLASDPFAYQNGSSELDVYASDGNANAYDDTKIAPNNWGGFSELN